VKQKKEKDDARYEKTRACQRPLDLKNSLKFKTTHFTFHDAEKVNIDEH
jgi:hypothetical protein